MTYDIEHIKEMTGTLITLDGSDVISDVFIEMDALTAGKLASVLRKNVVTKENQNLFFTSISIGKGGLDIFTKGQSSMVKDGNRYIMTTLSRNPKRFKGVMQSIVRGSDGFEYACEIEIGCMDFVIGDKEPKISNDIALFENVPVMIYPYGHYQVVILQDEN
jgi:hypothetical protein